MSDVPVPQVVASYAAYLRARTRAEPQIAVTGNGAEVSVGVRDKALVLTFGCPKCEWKLDSAEVRHGEQVTKFNSRELTKAVATLLTA